MNLRILKLRGKVYEENVSFPFWKTLLIKINTIATGLNQAQRGQITIIVPPPPHQMDFFQFRVYLYFTLTIFSSEPLLQEKQDDVYWVLQTVLRTIDRASEEGKLFTFVPDFYVDVCINSINALTSYFHPTVPYTSLPGMLHICFSVCRNWNNPLLSTFTYWQSMVKRNWD